ncbi:MAG: response regulator [Deltaproteobacteria bacterium]|nr:response regulator [Deltaproteobacteria bacterium]
MKNATDTTVLIVDDIGEMRMILRTILRHMGVRNILEAVDGLKAMEILGNLAMSQKLDLIIADWNMPNMSGLDLLKEVRKSAALKYIPFLMVTSENELENVLSAKDAGVTDYVVKPFNTRLLEAKLRDNLNFQENS